MELDNHWLVTAGLVASSVIAITANSFLLLIFCRRRGLRTVPNRFIINLLVTNLLSSFLLVPFVVVDQESKPSSSSSSSHLVPTSNRTLIEHIVIEEEIITTTNTTKNIEIIETNKITTESINFVPITNPFLCYFGQGSITFVCTLSILSILLIGVNQYFGVIHSLRYHFYINKCRSMVAILTTWTIALLFATVSCLTHSGGVWRFCPERVKLEGIWRILNTIYAFTYFIVIILAPFAAICIIYMCIYSAAHKNSERMRKSTSANLEKYNTTTTIHEKTTIMPKVHSAPNFVNFIEQSDEHNNKLTNCDTSSSSNNNNNNNKIVIRTSSERNNVNFITTLKHKLSNASVFKYREETRAAKISILVIFLVLVCYIPYGVTVILNCQLLQIETTKLFDYLALFLLIFSNVISPFLFAYRNKRVKREIGKMFGLMTTGGRRMSPPFIGGGRATTTKTTTTTRRPRSVDDIHHHHHHHHHQDENRKPFLGHNHYDHDVVVVVPEVVVTCKVESERKSILKRVCSSSNWNNYKKCNFITVPDSCISAEARGSFSSASTQISSEE